MSVGCAFESHSHTRWASHRTPDFYRSQSSYYKLFEGSAFANNDFDFTSFQFVFGLHLVNYNTVAIFPFHGEPGQNGYINCLLD